MTNEKKPFYEMIFLVILMVVSLYFIPKLFGIVSLLPIVYFFIESIGRKQNKIPIFKHKEILQDLNSTWIPFVTVAFYYNLSTFLSLLISHQN